ncbi:hypothetical protein IAT38_000841 [Cryptococcus sp. DSM 104549]
MSSESTVVNGNGMVYNGDAESSKMAADVDPVFHAVNLARGIFNVGYLNQEWSDVQLTFFASGLKAHRLILARSPYLAHLLSSVAPGSTVQLAFVDKNITEESVHITLQHLYSPSLHLVHPGNARSVLATAYLFGGMPELVHHAYYVSRDSLDASNVNDFVYWLGGAAEASSTMFGSVAVANGQEAGQKNGDGDVAAWLEEANPLYGEWTVRLKHDVLDYLLRVLPEKVVEAGSLSSLENPLLIAYAHLPYALFKFCVESPNVPIPSLQERFAFAKRVIAQRKKLAAASPGPQMEESAVLAFRGGDGMEVHVTRRPKKGRQYFKVEG